MIFQSPVHPLGVVKVSVFVLAGRPSVVWLRAVNLSAVRDFLPARRSVNVYMSSPHADAALTGCVLSVSVLSSLGRSPEIQRHCFQVKTFDSEWE